MCLTFTVFLSVRCSDHNFPVSPAASSTTDTNNVSALTAASSQLARMVAEGGDDIEEMARERNRDDPSMWLVNVFFTSFAPTKAK